GPAVVQPHPSWRIDRCEEGSILHRAPARYQVMEQDNHIGMERAELPTQPCRAPQGVRPEGCPPIVEDRLRKRDRPVHRVIAIEQTGRVGGYQYADLRPGKADPECP